MFDATGKVTHVRNEDKWHIYGGERSLDDRRPIGVARSVFPFGGAAYEVIKHQYVALGMMDAKGFIVCEIDDCGESVSEDRYERHCGLHTEALVEIEQWAGPPP